MKDKSFSQIKYNIAWASVVTIFIGAIVYVPALEFTQKSPEIIYKKVPVPVYITLDPVNMVNEENPEEQVPEKTFIPLTKNLTLGDDDPEVKILQEYLNNSGFLVAESGPGSPGQETTRFGRGTREALIKFQEANSEMILKPFGLTNGTGILGEMTRKFINS